MDNIIITKYLSGFHTFKKDHNYLNFRGDFINKISDTLNNLVVDSFNVGPQTVIKCKMKSELFEVKFGSNVLIYQDDLDFQNFVANAHSLLMDWKSFSDLIKLRLVGLVTSFSLNKESLKQVELPIFLNKCMRENTNIKELKKNSMVFSFDTSIDEENYTVQIQIENSKDDNELLVGAVDVFMVSEDSELGLKEEELPIIFEASKKFFENQFLEILNSGLKV
ncbi:MAG: hypothetical protein MUP85_24235 [Candidatus Lokiarchaeota archaeon]|nr:hypothetical protein [Candidatus Lokiarchaeota archaeon]